MRRALTLSISAACLGALILVASPASAAVRTVKGEIITIMCYQGHGMKGTGQAHRPCAVSCAKKGYPLGILASDGTYYQIEGPLTAHDNVKLQKYLASHVEARGTVGKAGGKPTISIASLSDITVVGH